MKYVQLIANSKNLFIYLMNIIYMTNAILFGSSIIMTFFNYIGLYKYNPKNDLLIYCILFGLITSILNHGLTHYIFKYLDRGMMILGFLINMYFTTKIYLKKRNNYDKYYVENIYFLIVFAVIMFFITKVLLKSGKVLINYIPHLIAHVIITIANILLFKENNKN